VCERPSGPQSRSRYACLAAGDGGDDGDFGVGREGGGEAACVAHVFFADEDVDVFADLALFVDDAIANAGMKGIEKRQGVGKNSRRLFNSDFAAAAGKFAQRARNMKSDGHDQVFFLERDIDWDRERDLLRDEGVFSRAKPEVAG